MVAKEKSQISRTNGAPTGIVTAACWIDLRVYRRMIAEGGFDPACAQAQRAISRLRTFQQVVAEHSEIAFPTLSVNDGAVAYRDVGLLPNRQLFDFVRKAWKLFRATSLADRRHSDEGVRAVVAVGLRARGSKRGMDAQQEEFSAILRALHSGELDLASAINRARGIKRLHDVVPQLQANFAFTKAYEAEQSGSNGGFQGANFFLDATVFRNSSPPWLCFGSRLRWPPPPDPLSCEYVPVQEFLEVDRASAAEDLRSGREILNLVSRQ